MKKCRVCRCYLQIVLCIRFFYSSLRPYSDLPCQHQHPGAPVAKDWLAMALLGLVWGASFLFIKRSVGIFTPLQMAMWRMVLATVIYLPVAVAYWSKIDWSRWKPLLIVAFCGSALPNFFFAIAQQHVNSSLAGALNALTPLFTLVIGASFFRMKASWPRFWGIVVGFVGRHGADSVQQQHNCVGKCFLRISVCAGNGLLRDKCEFSGILPE
jgi:hypothetical protein